MTDPKPPLTRREFLETAAGVTVAGSSAASRLGR